MSTVADLLDTTTVRPGRPREAWSAKTNPRPEILPKHGNRDAAASTGENRLFVLTDEVADVEAVRLHLDRKRLDDLDQKVIQINPENIDSSQELLTTLRRGDIKNIGFIVRNGTRNIVERSVDLFKYLKDRVSSSITNTTKLYLAADGSLNNPASIANSSEQQPFNITKLSRDVFSFLCNFLGENFNSWINDSSPGPLAREFSQDSHIVTEITGTTGHSLKLSGLRHIIHQPAKQDGKHNLQVVSEINDFIPFVNKVFNLVA